VRHLSYFAGSPRDACRIEHYAKEIPGAGEYDTERSFRSLKGPAGGKFNSSKPKSDIDWTIYRAAQMPGPGEYSPLPSKSKGGGKFNESKPKSDIEVSLPSRCFDCWCIVA
jgi:hypothetical protein